MAILKFDLVADEKARNRAIVKQETYIHPGEIVLRVEALATALLPEFKARRCDWCLRTRDVKACSKCKEVYYCDRECQILAWEREHKKSCAWTYGREDFVENYSQEPGLKSTGDLLVNLLASLLCSKIDLEEVEWPEPGDISVPNMDELSSPIKCFTRLLAHPFPRELPPLPTQLRNKYQEFLHKSWARFDCNHFVLHTIAAQGGSYGVGIFPLASRFFNHACSPNAWCAFVLREKKVWLEIRALEAIREGEEITIPYLDSALTFLERQTRLRHVYNFTCLCAKCTLERALPVPEPPPRDLSPLNFSLMELVFGTTNTLKPRNAGITYLRSLPSSVRNGEFMKILSERFETIAHEGPYEDLWDTGRALLALYLLHYPANYPLTAYDALELAKVCWNAHVREELSPPSKTWTRLTLEALDFCEPMLRIVGGEEEQEEAMGLDECRRLRALVKEES